MSRRSFITAAIGASAGLALSRPSELFASDGPQKGGHFRLGMIEGETTDSWDPRLTGTTYMVHVNFQTRNCLVEIGPGMRLEPELAEVIEPRSGGSKWAFKLRKGVEFHNGKSLTAADVIYSINLHRSADTKSGAKALLKSVRDVAADGNDTVIFTLDTANVDFPYILADYHFVIVPDGTQNFLDGVGTGGYVLEDFRAGVSTRVRRNPNYWKQNRAWFDSIDTINITDGSARNSALLAGSVDAIVQTDPLTADLLAKKTGFQLLEVTGTQHVTLPMDTQLAPFNNNDVRLALKHSVDRNRLVKTLLRGHGGAASDHPIAPVDRYFASDITPTPYDPDKARFYLKKAGLSSLALNLDCSDAVLSFGVDLASLCQQSAKPAGVGIEIVRHPADGYWDSVWMQKPWCEGFWAGRPTADWMFTQAYAKDAAWNESHWVNGRFNALLIQARAELDESKRASMYNEMQHICHDDGGSVIPFFTNILDGASSKVRFGKLGSNLAGDSARCGERWWFA